MTSMALSSERSEQAREVWDKIVGYLTKEIESLERSVKTYQGGDGVSDFAFGHAYQLAADVIYNDILPLFGARADATPYKLGQIVNRLLVVRDALAASNYTMMGLRGDYATALGRTSLASFGLRQMHEMFVFAAAKLDEMIHEAFLN